MIPLLQPAVINGQRVMDLGLNVATLHMASRLWPVGFRTDKEFGRPAPETYEDLKDLLDSGFPLIVSTEGCDNTIYGDREVNYAARAWHDWCHYVGKHDFSPEGEAAACAMQVEHLKTLYGDTERTRLWARILDAEVNGQGAYFRKRGAFPADQYGFVETYLQTPERAVNFFKFH